jgi:GTPase
MKHGLVFGLDGSCMGKDQDYFHSFRFVQRPEFLAPGDRVLFREGKTKGLGIVKSIG